MITLERWFPEYPSTFNSAEQSSLSFKEALSLTNKKAMQRYTLAYTIMILEA